MKKILVKTKIIDDLGKVTSTEVTGSLDEAKNILYYKDINVKACVIIGPKTIIERSSANYKLSLVFENNMIHRTCYEIFNPKMELELVTSTEGLIVNRNSIHIQYCLKMNQETIGNFVFDIEWEEQK